MSTPPIYSQYISLMSARQSVRVYPTGVRRRRRPYTQSNSPGGTALRASSSGDVVVPRTRRRIVAAAFSVSAPQAWNTLMPTPLKLLRSTNAFRRQRKTFLFHSAHGHRKADCFVVRLRSSSTGRNTNDSVTVTVTFSLL